MSFAVARTLETRVDAGGAALRLAKIEPKDLVKQIWVIRHRLEKGYMGGSVLSTDTSPDLKAFLQVESTNQRMLNLIQRLIDCLGIRLAST